jgi:hypothetical protein
MKGSAIKSYVYRYFFTPPQKSTRSCCEKLCYLCPDHTAPLTNHFGRGSAAQCSFWLAGLLDSKNALARRIFCNSKISARLIGALQFAQRLAICKMTTDELKQHLGD